MGDEEVEERELVEFWFPKNDHFCMTCATAHNNVMAIHKRL